MAGGSQVVSEYGELSVSEDAFIEVDRVEKVFDVRRRTGFLRRELRQVRAVDELSFSVARGRWSATSGRTVQGSRRRSRC